MSEAGRRGFLAAVRRLFGRGREAARTDAAKPGPPQVPPPSAPAPVGAGPPQLRWFRERPLRSSSGQVTPPARRPRQTILAVLASASVLATIVVFSLRGLAPRTAPREVRGLWRTDTGSHRGRHFEIRTRRVAFQTGDAGQVGIYEISRVWRSRGGDSTAVRLELREQGLPLELAFVYVPGPPEQIRFAHQRALVWTRAPGGRTIIPGF